MFVQRALRTQEKLNRIGADENKRAMLLPFLQCVKEQLDLIPEAADAKRLLENYLAGSHTARLGEVLASLLRALSDAKSKCVVAKVILAISDELLKLIPIWFAWAWNGPALIG